VNYYYIFLSNNVIFFEVMNNCLIFCINDYTYSFKIGRLVEPHEVAGLANIQMVPEMEL
jgi:hypothetical protein